MKPNAITLSSDFFDRFHNFYISSRIVPSPLEILKDFCTIEYRKLLRGCFASRKNGHFFAESYYYANRYVFIDIYILNNADYLLLDLHPSYNLSFYINLSIPIPSNAFFLFFFTFPYLSLLFLVYAFLPRITKKKRKWIEVIGNVTSVILYGIECFKCRDRSIVQHRFVRYTKKREISIKNWKIELKERTKEYYEETNDMTFLLTNICIYTTYNVKRPPLSLLSFPFFFL